MYLFFGRVRDMNPRQHCYLALLVWALPVAAVTQTASPFLLVVHPAVKAKTTQGLIAMANAEPGKLNF